MLIPLVIGTAVQTVSVHPSNLPMMIIVVPREDNSQSVMCLSEVFLVQALGSAKCSTSKKFTLIARYLEIMNQVASCTLKGHHFQTYQMGQTERIPLSHSQKNIGEWGV